MEVRERRAELEAAGLTAVAVGFSRPEALADLAEHLQWPWPFLSDPRREVYHRLDFQRAGLLAVYSPGTLLRYGRAALTGKPIHRPVEDTRQLGGDAIVRRGEVLRLFPTRGPDDRAPVPELLVAAYAIAKENGGR